MFDAMTERALTKSDYVPRDVSLAEPLLASIDGTVEAWSDAGVLLLDADGARTLVPAAGRVDAPIEVGAQVETGQVLGYLVSSEGPAALPARTSWFAPTTSSVDWLMPWELFIVGANVLFPSRFGWMVAASAALSLGHRVLTAARLRRRERARPPKLPASSPSRGGRLPAAPDALERCVRDAPLDASALQPLARHVNPVVARAAAERLAAGGGTAPLWDLTHRGEPSIRAGAYRSLEWLGGPDDLERLVVLRRTRVLDNRPSYLRMPEDRVGYDAKRAERSLTRRFPDRVQGAKSEAQAVLLRQRVEAATRRRQGLPAADHSVGSPWDEDWQAARYGLDLGVALPIGALVLVCFLNSGFPIMEATFGGLILGVLCVPFAMAVGLGRHLFDRWRAHADEQLLLRSGVEDRQPGQLGLAAKVEEDGTLGIIPADRGDPL